MIEIPEIIQRIIAGILVGGAIVFLIRLRLKSSKKRSGSCSNCDLE